MFNKTERQIRYLLELYSLEDILDQLDLTPEYVLELLIEGGHCALPPWMDTTPV